MQRPALERRLSASQLRVEGVGSVLAELSKKRMLSRSTSERSLQAGERSLQGRRPSLAARTASASGPSAVAAAASKEKKGRRKATLSGLLKAKKAAKASKSTADADALADPARARAFLASGDLSVEDVRAIGASVRSSAGDWMPRFVYSGAVPLVFQLLQPPSAVRIPGVVEVYLEAMACVRLLLANQYSLEATLEAANVQIVVAVLEQCGSEPRLVQAAAQALESVCYLEKGYKATRAVLLERQEAAGGGPLLAPFDAAFSSVDDREAKAAVVRTLNVFLQETAELEERFGLASALLRLGWSNAILGVAAGDDELTAQLYDFEQQLSGDHAAMVRSLGLAVASTSSMPASGDCIAVQLPLKHGGAAEVLLAYTADMRVAELLEIVGEKQSYLGDAVDDLEPWGLYVCAGEDEDEEESEEEIALDPNATLAECGLKGSVRLEFKLRPWELSIHIADGTELEVEADPDSAIAEIVSAIVSAEVDEMAEFGLYWQQRGEWLDPANQVSAYPALRTEEHALLFRKKQAAVVVRFREHEVHLDLGVADAAAVTLEQLRPRAAAAMGLAEHQLSASYGWRKQGPGDAFLQASTTVQELRDLHSNAGLELALTPDHLEVEADGSGERARVRLFLHRPVAEALPAVALALRLASDRLRLVRRREEGGEFGLLSRFSFANQGIGADTPLVAVHLPEEAEEGDACNVWEEPAGGHALRTRLDATGAEVVVAGTLNKLVERASSEDEYDPKFAKMFLLTYRSFCTPELLVKKLIERYHVPDDIGERSKVKVQMRTCVVLKQWVESCNADEELAQFDTLVAFVKEQLAAGGPAVLERITQAIAKKKEAGPHYYFNELPPTPTMFKFTKFEAVGVLDLDSQEIARQITLFEFQHFSKITPIELFGQAWSKEELQHLCPNLLQMIGLFNRLSRWVGSEIVQQRKLTARAKVFQKFVSIASHLRQLNSYNSLTAIVSGLNCSSVNRLNWTKAKVPKRHMQTLAALEELTNMENSYKNYRNAIQSFQPPLIPYMGVYLQDLTFIEDGNPDYIDGLVNVEKRALVYRILEQIATFQVEAYNFVALPILRTYIESYLCQLDDKEMYAMSLQHEPRNAKKSDLL